MDDCHPGGRLVEAFIAREMYRALGFEVCETCHHVTAIRWRQHRFAPRPVRHEGARPPGRSRMERGW